MTKKKLCIILSVVAFVMVLSIVTMVKDDVFKSEFVAGNKEENLKTNKSDFRGVVRAVEPDVNKMYIRDVDYSLDSEYDYKNSLSIKDKNGNEITYSQIKIGDMYRIKYDLVDDVRIIKEMKLCQGMWEYSDITGVYYDGEKLEVGDEEFETDIKTVVIDGLGLISLDNICQDDVVDIKGIGDKVYCVVIKKKHAIIKLSNYKEYLGGTIEVGLNKRQTISDDTEIFCKEGKYDVVVKKGNRVVQKSIRIKSGEVFVVDVANAKQTKQSEVSFTIIPVGAVVYIDGTKYSNSQLKSIIMPYGVYDIVAAYEGYKKYSAQIRIDKEQQDVLISLEQNQISNETSTDSGNNSNNDTNISNNNVNEDNQDYNEEDDEDVEAVG